MIVSVNEKGNITVNAELDARDLLINSLGPQLWKGDLSVQPSEAAKNLASSLVCVPQVMQALLDLITYGITMQGDAPEDWLIKEFQRRYMRLIAPEGEAYHIAIDQRDDAERSVCELKEKLTDREQRIIELELIELRLSRAVAELRSVVSAKEDAIKSMQGTIDNLKELHRV